MWHTNPKRDFLPYFWRAIADVDLTTVMVRK